MRFLILRILTHSELGMFHEYRRQGKEGSKQRAINFDWDVVDRVFPAAKDSDQIPMDLLYDTDHGVTKAQQWLTRQKKNWRLEGNCPRDRCYGFVTPGCLFAMEIDSGKNPGDGAWAVFPPEHEVTSKILANGESSGLTKSAMIALYDEEGIQIQQILSTERPDLFTAPSQHTESHMATVRDASNNGVLLAPNPRRLVKILSEVGHTMQSAVADLVDNAITEDATSIQITFGRPDAGHGRWMSIADNGRGMDAKGLAEAMRIGSDSDYEENSLGKYGYGLKGASWSQTKVFTVVSKTEGGAVHHLTWDVEDMDGWIAKSDPLEPWEQKATAIGSSGTVVLWKDMRPPQHMPISRGLDPYSAEIMILERHLGLVFHRFLEGKALGRKKVAITINGKSVVANNPVGHPLASSYDAKTVRIPTEEDDGKVHVQAYLLPNEDEIAEHHATEGAEAARRAREQISLHGSWNESQGLFIYRHDRLIAWGGWHQMWKTNDEKTKLARVIVDFNSVLDDAFKINISKQSVQLPMQLQTEIKPLADAARKDSQRKYRKPRPVPPASSSPSKTATGHADPSGKRSRKEQLPPEKTGSGTNQVNPKVLAKEVKTDKFVWKVTDGLTGTKDVQISELNPKLLALMKHLRSDHDAIAHLADFLESLDSMGIQKHLIPKE